MAHPNEDRLRTLYATFASGDLQGFLDGCTDDVTFSVPGSTPVSGLFSKVTFVGWIGIVFGLSGGTFREEVIDVCANDEHGVLLLLHTFERGEERIEYRTAHICELRDGLVARWTEYPGSLAEFEAAWAVT